MTTHPQLDDMPPQPWRWLCNVCNAAVDDDRIPRRCDNCGGVEWRVITRPTVRSE
ncbi:MAG: hypothetical protein PHU85_01950 [Phycisphaerae bacterium]|nr:hypothetical protein [Phycisphaerae bacterium]